MLRIRTAAAGRDITQGATGEPSADLLQRVAPGLGRLDGDEQGKTSASDGAGGRAGTATSFPWLRTFRAPVPSVRILPRDTFARKPCGRKTFAFNGITMRNTKIPFLFALLLICAFSGPFLGQQRVRLAPAMMKSVRLDPANYIGADVSPGCDGATSTVVIKATKPITIFLRPRLRDGTRCCNTPSHRQSAQLCTQEHVMETTYVCDCRRGQWTLVI